MTRSILLSIIPGLLAVAAIVYAIRHTAAAGERERRPLSLHVRPVLRGRLGRLLAGISVFELGNVAATLLILRATDLLTPVHGTDDAAQIAIALYVVYNLAATVASVPAGRLGDRRGMVRVLAAGVAAFGFAYAGFAATGASIPLLAVAFALAGIGIGCVETAEHAAVATLAPEDIRGSGFGVLAAVQSLGNLVASATAGLMYTLASPAAAFTARRGTHGRIPDRPRREPIRLSLRRLVLSMQRRSPAFRPTQHCCPSHLGERPAERVACCRGGYAADDRGEQVRRGASRLACVDFQHDLDGERREGRESAQEADSQGLAYIAAEPMLRHQ